MNSALKIKKKQYQSVSHGRKHTQHSRT